jgi:type IV pilus assembly protein PilC
MTYKYIAYTADKKVVEGVIEVTSETIAEGALYRAGFQNIIRLEEMAPGFSLEKSIPSLFGIKSRDIIDTSNQLATLIQSGITVVTALKLLETQTPRKPLKKVFRGLIEEIQGGSSFSQALSNYPQAFSLTYCQVIKASEQAGILDTGLRQAASYMQKQAHAKERVTRAMVYPAFVIIMAVVVSILLMVVAMPPLIKLFESFNANIPWTTRLMITLSGFFLHHSGYVFGGLIGLILIIAVLLRIPSVQHFRDRFMLKIPLLGIMSTERSMELFCQTGSMLLGAGLRLPQIMDIVIGASRNRVIREAFNGVKERLLQGEGLSQPMSDNKMFPSMMVEMVLVGEKTGSMDATLSTLAEFYERRVDRRVEMMIALIEPILTVLIGLVVIFIALSLITPMYSILKSVN